MKKIIVVVACLSVAFSPMVYAKVGKVPTTVNTAQLLSTQYNSDKPASRQKLTGTERGVLAGVLILMVIVILNDALKPVPKTRIDINEVL